MEEEKDKIEISVIKGDKLFNQNTPFIINLSSPDPDINDKKSNADLICVIDTSSSMKGQKLYQVKESLKILIDLMDEKDRLALILFNRKASIYFNLEYITKEKKNLLKTEIDEIYTNRGTNILSGLEKAIEILKKEKNEVNINRVFSVLLLSDGCDTYNNEIQLANSLKEMTKGFDLSFTLHTFGYGYYYDEKIMNKLANLRDGSFFFVENYSKVSEYFACVLGGCMSVISEKAEIKVNLLNKNCKIIKIFGGENLYEYELKDELFITKILQFMCGKEYTFVLEINIDENNIKVGDELLDIKFIYEDISQNNNNNNIEKEIKYKYELQSIDYLRANEEYIRSQVYSVLDEVLKLKEKNENNKARKMLNEMKVWIKDKYKGNNKNYLIDIEKTYEIFKGNTELLNKSIKFVNSQIMQNQSKKQGSNLNYCNSIQNNLMNSIQNINTFKSAEPPLKKRIDLSKSINFGKFKNI